METSHNDKAVADLIWALKASQDQFSLILAHCNYSGLRNRIIRQIHEQCPLGIRDVILPRMETRVYEVISGSVENDMPDAVMVQGLESAEYPDKIFARVNQVRERFLSQFPFPIIIWVNDMVLRKFIRVAPDMENVASASVEFRLSDDDWLRMLQQNAGRFYDEIIRPDPVSPSLSEGEFLPVPHELESFLNDLKDRHPDLTPESEADLSFLRGRNAFENKGDMDGAISFYEESLQFWESQGDQEKQGVLLYFLGRCHQEKNDFENAISCLQDCIRAFAEHEHLREAFERIG